MTPISKLPDNDAEILARFVAATADTEDEALCRDFDAWLAGDEGRHGQAEIYRRISADVRALDGIYAAETRALRRRALVRQAGRRAALPVAAALALAAVWVAQPHLTYTVSGKDGRPAEVALWDGSHIALDAGAEVGLSYLPWVRRATLNRGTALFDIRHLSFAPFSMQAGAARISDLGTRFLVRAEPEQTGIAVFEGSVEVATTGVDRSLILTAGHAAVATSNGGVVAASPELEDEATAWRDGRVIFHDTALSEVATTLARYWPDLDLRAADSAAGLRVSGSFGVADRDRLLRTLEAVLPVTVQRYNHVITFVARRSPA